MSKIGNLLRMLKREILENMNKFKDDGIIKSIVSLKSSNWEVTK